jgi:hypothetical protein
MSSTSINNIISLTKSKNKCKNEQMFETIMPTVHNYNSMLSNKYSIKELKHICKYYKIKTSGNKSELTSRIYDYLHKKNSAIKIQRYWRKYLSLHYDKTHGPARKNRKLCVNETDFYSMEPLESISYNQFYSFKDIDNMIYGFDILSLANLLLKGGNDTTNPYNRNPLPETVNTDIVKLIKLSKIIGNEINITIEESEKMSPLKEVELKSLALFLDMDDLGNYTDPMWFWILDRNKIIKFLRELSDIWMYRAQLTQQTRYEICPPGGDPFRGINISYLNNMNLTEIRKIAISIMESFIKRGINNSSKSLGANFVLCALTLVNTDAANALPWLFQSVSHT